MNQQRWFAAGHSGNLADGAAAIPKTAHPHRGPENAVKYTLGSQVHLSSAKLSPMASWGQMWSRKAVCPATGGESWNVC